MAGRIRPGEVFSYSRGRARGGERNEGRSHCLVAACGLRFWSFALQLAALLTFRSSLADSIQI